MQIEKQPDKLLYNFLDINGRPTESYTYAKFGQRIIDIAAHIQASSRPNIGDRILLVYPPGIEMIAGLLAATRLGLIPVPVYPPTKHDLSASLERMAFVAHDCGAKIILSTRACSWLISWAQVKQKLERLSLKNGVIDSLQRVLSDEAPTGCNNQALPPPENIPSDTLFLQYTSGSTRDPRGVRVTHHGLLANYKSTVDHDPVCVSWLPQYHDLGLIGYYLFIALRGGTTHGFSPVDFIRRPALWLETMSKYGATASAGPNFAFAYCLRPDKVSDASLDGLDLSRLEYLATAAEPVNPNTFRRFQSRFARCGLKPRALFSSYGLSEYTLVVSQYGRTIQAFDQKKLNAGRVRPIAPTTTTQPIKELVSCGQPLACTTVKIVSTNGPHRGCRPDEVGEIWLHGPAMGGGYWGKPQLTEQVFKARLPETGDQDWLRTGDLGFLYKDELYIAGRLKDLIIIRGRNHYPQDIESVVESHDAIRPGCSAAFSVERDGAEVLVIVAELSHPKTIPDTHQLNHLLVGQTGVGAATWVFIQPRSIPKTSSGKIRRHQTRMDFLDKHLKIVEQFESDTPLPPISADSTHPLFALFQRYQLSGQEQETLSGAGLDSLQIAEFAHDLEITLETLGGDNIPAVVDLRLLQTIVVADLVELLAIALEAGHEARPQFQDMLVGLQADHHDIEARLMLEDASPQSNRRAKATNPMPGGGGGIFLTGGTGFLGPFLVHSLLKQTQDPLTVLVRGDNPTTAKVRLLEGLRGANLSLSVAEIDRLSVVCGDLAKPQLGLNQTRWKTLAQNTHTIVHNGAMVNYLYNYEAMRDANVLGTKALIALAFDERLKVFNHISTTFVFGWSKQDVLSESDINTDLGLLDFGYSQTKWVSEKIVRDALSKGLPGRIFRPALVSPTGDCSTADADISVRLLAFMVKHRIGTSAPNQVSFTPVDQVAENIVAIALNPESLGQTLHVTRDEYASLADVTEILGRLSGVPIALLDLHDFVAAVIARCTKEDPLFPLLNFFVRSTDNISSMSFKRYDNSQYRAARAGANCSGERSLEAVVTGIYEYMKKQGFAPASPQDTTTGS